MSLTVIIPVYNQEELVTRAIQSCPEAEIIVVNDASTDKTLQSILNSGRDVKVITNSRNLGVGLTVNKGLDAATGDYIVLLGSDDYFLPSINEVIQKADADLVYFDLVDNNGAVYELNRRSKNYFVGSVKLMRREFIGDTRNPDKRVAEDKDFFAELQKKKPKEQFTGIIAKHYNFPRIGSLSYEANIANN